MSFFNDIYKEFNISDTKKYISISFVVEVGLSVVGKFKLDDFSETTFILKSSNEIITIVGENLVIKSYTIGELILTGNIKNIMVNNNEKKG